MSRGKKPNFINFVSASDAKRNKSSKSRCKMNAFATVALGINSPSAMKSTKSF